MLCVYIVLAALALFLFCSLLKAREAYVLGLGHSERLKVQDASCVIVEIDFFHFAGVFSMLL